MLNLELTLFTLRYILLKLLTSHMYIAPFDQRLEDKSIIQVRMDDELSSLKVKLYIFTSANDEQQQDQQQMPSK